MQDLFRLLSTRLRICALFMMALGWTSHLHATEISAGTGWWQSRGGTQTGFSTWVFSEPTARDTILWQSGVNQTDGVLHPLQIFGPEGKFDFSTGTFAPRTYTGFNRSDGPGPLGSFAFTTGNGSSALVPHPIIPGVVPTATWAVSARGSLGSGAGASWSARARADDPVSIAPAQLAHISEPTYDLFDTVGLLGGTLSSEGNVELGVSYETATGATNLLDIEVNAAGATVTSDSPPGLSFFLLDSLVGGPTEPGSGNPISLMDIQSMVDSDIAPDLSIASPLFIGIYWQGIPVPTVDLGDGAVARIDTMSMAFDEAQAVVEPSTFALLGSGLLWVGLYQAQRVRRRSQRHWPVS
jgi:hypothetical protein